MILYATISLLSLVLFQTEISVSEPPAIDFVIESNLNQLDYPNVCGIYQTAEGISGEDISTGNNYSGRSIYLFPGWPMEVSGFQERGAIYCNMDSDSAMEIISNTGNKVYAWNLDGSLVSGWPQSLNLHAYGAPALGDVDGDGVDEIVVGTMMGGTGNSGWLFVFEKDGSAVSGFPLFLPNGGAARTPALCDLDNDGTMEIIIEERNWPDGWVSVYNGDGTVRSGWPQQMNHVPSSGAAVGDITGDGVPEIVAVSYLSVYAYDISGNLLPGFPYTPAGDRAFSYSTPILADMNNDNNREIICGDLSTSAGNGKVHVIQSDGSLLAGWPKTTTHWIYAPPAVGDIDGDGQPDIVIGDKYLSGSPGNHVYGWDASGTALPGFPIGPVWAVNSQIIIVDIDGDQEVELLFDDNSATGGIGNYHSYNHDGTITDGWPLDTEGTTFFKNPFIADLNIDGNLDIVGAGEDQDGNLFVHAWHTDIPVDSTLNYLTILGYNLQHTGVYMPPSSTGINTNQTNFTPSRVSVGCFPNPFFGMVSISVLGVDLGQEASIVIRDLSGRVVQTISRESNGENSVNAVWNGIDLSGNPVASGIYSVTVSVGNRIGAIKMITLLR